VTTPSKIIPPKSSGLFPRERLFKRIDDLQDRPIIWITGPAGSGKTSLTSSYLKKRSSSVLWYQIDSGDNDIATFFYYLGMAAEKIFPGKNKSLPLLTPEYLQDIPTFTRRFFERLFGFLRKPSFIIFDNYQEIQTDSLMHQLISIALSMIPPHIKVCFLSRLMPPPEMIRLRANDLMGIISWQDLRLDLAETIEIARSRYRKNVSEVEFTQLHQTIDGWVAGLILTIESMKINSSRFQRLRLQPSEEIFEYFAKEVFFKSEDKLQNFFLQTAFFPKISIEMAQKLTGSLEAGQILNKLSKNSFFTVEHGQQIPQYEYHPLFRNFLMDLVQKRFSQDYLADLQNKAARLLLEDGQIEAAVTLFQKINQWEILVPLILKCAPTMISQGRDRPLEQWLRSLPSEVVEKNGWLLYWLGISLMTQNLSESRSHLERAFSFFDGQKDMYGQLLSWSGIVSTIIFSQDDFSQLDKWIDWIDSQADLPLHLTKPGLEEVLVTSMMGALTYRRPNHPKVEQWIAKAQQVSEDSSNLNLRIRASVYLGVYFFWTGHFARLRHIVNQVQKNAALFQNSPLPRIVTKWTDSHYFFFHNPEGEACQRTAQEGLDTAKTLGVHLFDMQLYGNVVVGLLVDGKILEARGFLERMHSVGRGRYSKAQYYYLSSWQAYLSNDHQLALFHAEQALNFITNSGYLLVEVPIRIVFAELLFETGKQEEAAKQLAMALNLADRLGGEYFIYICNLTQARFALQKKGDSAQKKAGLNHLRLAMAAGRTLGLLNNYWWVPSWMTTLCLTALEEGIEIDYVQKVVIRRRLFPDIPPYHCKNWPWEIKIQTFGRFQITRNGEIVRFPVKAPKKVLLLLKALIACGSRGSSEEQLAQFLWPEADGDLALQSLATSLHRLRQLLDIDGVLSVRDGWTALNAKFCWVDAHVFEELLRRADEQASPTLFKSRLLDKNQHEWYKLLETAVSLYQGAFLEDLNEPWAIVYREKLSLKFSRALLQLGEKCKNSGALDLAVAYYEKGLEVDDLAESLYLGLMSCYQALGKSPEALKIYQRCKTVLKTKLNAHPSKEIESLRISLEKSL
jgi:ATP/maltotriose-dependent transcriptional regulator MalT/DNA-binding SARP family transcriptional activator